MHLVLYKIQNVVSPFRHVTFLYWRLIEGSFIKPRSPPSNDDDSVNYVIEENSDPNDRDKRV